MSIVASEEISAVSHKLKKPLTVRKCKELTDNERLF